MAHDCCAHHKVASSQLKSKSILFLGAGLLSMIPMVETFFLSFGGGISLLVYQLRFFIQ